ncbi:mitotic spindle assembly checkpoint protein MAD1-like [Halichondria panicea]|uniref:mitotic spindle assembly checkpoint protein MAD1-like n=1 Tax=Halichondria panicea TaxID=6063 RepID=UPI00312B3B33
MEEEEIGSPNSSKAYEADVSLSESYGSVALSEALPNEDCLERPPPVTYVRRPPPLSSVRQQVELIRARSRIVELESALAAGRRAVKRARIEEDDHVTSHVTLDKEEQERLHKLEQERCKLLEEMSSKKSELEATKDKLEEVKSELTAILSDKETEMKKLREEVAELRSGLDDSNGSRARLVMEVDSLRLQAASHAVQELDTLTAAHTRTVESLTARLKGAEVAEGALKSSQARVKDLERQLKTHRQDSYLMETVRERLLLCDELERRMGQLQEENSVLIRNRDNQHLLRYKVTSLTERCERLQGLEESAARLTLENTQLKERLEGVESGGGASTALLQYRVSQLQNNEKILVAKRGELEAKLHTTEADAAVASHALKEVKGQLSKAQQECKDKDEKIQRLEKRLLFVTKEREGCMNVLNSYSRDSGVDGILKQSISELESQVVRANARIAELEIEIEQHSSRAIAH